ncbi:MAG: endonuclease III domain-containing protein [Mariprofundaceae bacterium]
MVGAILTQNTNWKNVEMAIASLKDAGMLDAEKIAACDTVRIGELIRASGFFKQKAARLKIFCRFYLAQGKESGLKRLGNPRQALLALHGIGPETADSMLLYALNIPVFVVDAYTQRIFSRLGLLAAKASYADTQQLFHDHLTVETGLFNEYHALIVAHAKRHCRVKPLCSGCPLHDLCPTGHKTKT